MAIRILIVDDYAPFRSSARNLLEACGFDVVGEAVDGRSALDAVARLRPDLLLLDVQLPDFDGFEVVRRLPVGADRPAVIMTSVRDDVGYGARLASAQVLGFIAKTDLTGESVADLVGRPA